MSAKRSESKPSPRSQRICISNKATMALVIGSRSSASSSKAFVRRWMTTNARRIIENSSSSAVPKWNLSRASRLARSKFLT